MLDLGAARQRPDDPSESVFPCRHAQADKFFPKAVERAQVALTAAGKDANGLDGYTWHCNRHTFTSRLVMAGVDLRSVQDLGGWRSLAMVQRYAHLAPSICTKPSSGSLGRSPLGPMELRRNFDTRGERSRRCIVSA